MNAKQRVVLVADDDGDGVVMRLLEKTRTAPSPTNRSVLRGDPDTLWPEGVAKVEAGLISLEELHRVVPR